MHIAFLSSLVTDGKPASGFEIANEAIVGGLRELGHKVTVIGFRLPRQRSVKAPDTVVLGELEVENASVGRLTKAGWVLRALKTGLPMSAAKLTSLSSEAFDTHFGKSGPFDAVVVNSYQMAAAFPRLTERPFAYVAHNVEHRSAAQNAIGSSSAGLRFLYRRDGRLLHQIEADLFERARYLWALSGDDLEAFPREAGRGGVLPLIVPGVTEIPENRIRQYDAGVIGTWSWEPNRVGLEWFLNEVVPHLPQSYRIAVAGTVPASVATQSANVEFVGRVEDAGEFLASVRVVPLISRSGTGVQLKTLEAFQSGLACVATPSSLRGIPSIPENCLAAEEAIDFASSLKVLVEQSRDGTLPGGDGARFERTQRTAMLKALDVGISSMACGETGA